MQPPAPKITLYSIPISHPVHATRLMLDYKGLPYKRIDLPNGAHALILRLLGFSRGSAPAIKIDGHRVQGTLEISRELDLIKPDPPLFPANAAERTKVEEAERWGERELQPIGRFAAIASFERDRSTLPELTADANLPLQPPPRFVAAASKPLVMIQRFRHKADDAPVRAALSKLPAALNRVEELLDEGVIGGDRPNAADFQIATSVRVLLLFDDLRPLIEDRSCSRYARDLIPRYPGHIPAVLPREWLEPLRTAAPV